MARLRRLFSSEPLTAGRIVRLDARETHHARNVLRLGENDSLVIFDGRGNQFQGRIVSYERHAAVVVPETPVPAAPETPLPIVLPAALAKGAAFETVLQHAAELGVWRVVPYFCERSVVRLDKAARNRKRERWREIVLDATKQCGRARIMGVEEACSFDESVRSIEPSFVRLCCAGRPEASTLSATLAEVDRNAVEGVALMVGPEGGLTGGEIDDARARGWQMVSLGPRTLRVETAALASLAIVLSWMGEA
jgi:16S rRNA (uracil1498-N3)-methyltransferase